MSKSTGVASRPVSVSDVSTPRAELFARVLDPASRANPYPLYAALRSEPVSRQSDGTWVVSGFDEIAALLHDPRISSDMTNAGQSAGGQSLIMQDPPNHDRLRAAVMGRFTPEVVESLRQEVHNLIDGLLDAVGSGTSLDLVEEIAYPLPVSVICALLGIPPQDEARFHGWADTLARTLDLDPTMSREEQAAIDHAFTELHHYLENLVADRAEHRGDDLVSGLLTGGDRGEPLRGQELLITVRLLLIAGHETTVNLITNGMLTLLRHPDILERFRREPELVVPMVEELVRYEPSVQFRYRAALADIEIAGTTIPRGSVVVLLLAAGSRDPGHFTDPDSFVPDRIPNEHFGFGGGIHYCIGAPLARMEAQIVLPELVRRLINPRLTMDPPPYRPTAALRGPRHLWIEVDGIRP
ncbi:cytochrome P450 [Catenulispora sp. NF23]|uniref:Cytochrome P450 n=1 Tax=Catenulispora pinistramenti TaxID=2705254 RepID=A0ABS5KPH2_9ACTN|nr:cytochrome P450 [Catenulispora pinistramenti]MBS2533456.1 cytochrome P450 [Catenulispora pinistramenti]MBS2547936.1 cytochrome P450 [Catenulispora pinistramenti]